MDFKKIIQDNNLGKLFQQNDFGIEREALRTNHDNTLALTDQPDVLGKRATHPYILTDFSESQAELVTPPSSLEDTFRWLAAIHDVYLRSVKEDEYLWPFSMPNILPENDDQVPIIKVPEQSEIDYREYLAKHYGKKLQMMSGIHFNFSFNDEFTEQIFNKQTTFSTEREVRNELYLKLARNYLRYQWILTYLFGAAPYADESFYQSKTHPKTQPKEYYRSLRNSSYGYNNPSDIEVDYNSVEEYVHTIEKMVETNGISEEREFYGNARLRGKGVFVREMLNSGVQYVEFRSIDINPFDEFGISIEQSKFIHLLFLTLVWMDKNITEDEVKYGNELNEKIGSENPFEPTQYKDEGLKIIELMRKVAEEISMDESYFEVVTKAEELFHYPEKTYSAKLLNEIEERDSSYLEYGKELGLKYKQKAFEKYFLLRGFDMMEMSSQLLIFDSIQKGLEVEILDENDQFIRLTYEDHSELIRNANMTSKDTTISHWLMGNKTVTKILLNENGFDVPGGSEYQTIDSALDDFYRYENKEFVVKPKSTNYGVGISVFKQAPSKKSFQEALKIAFKEDDDVLVEDYIEGTEYRFFILDGKTQAVLLRIPANVTGDGKKTISQLIDEKNEDLLRGENHRAPLEKIQKGDIELLMLKEQGYTFESIPDNQETVYLRENSNISTGGDSIDFTDEMHQSYKNIAEQMAEVLDVKVTGVDLIIPDYKTPSTTENPGYTVIEANFNPAMHMHSYVYKGKGRRLTQGIVDMLFPELPIDK